MNIKSIFSFNRSKPEKLRSLIIDQNLPRIRKLLDSERSLVNAVYTEYNNTTALHIVASIGNISMTNLFIERGANVNAKQNDNRTPLISAVHRDHVEVARILLNNGADVDASNIKEEGVTYMGLAAGTPLHWAAQKGSEKMVELLINKGANIDLICADGKTALHWSLMSTTRYSAAKLLIENGANVNAKANDGKRPLHFVVNHLYTLTGRANKGFAKPFSLDIEMASLLLGKGVDIDAQDDDLYTPLMLASAKPFVNIGLVKLLLEDNADSTLVGKSGVTALQYSCNMLNQVSSVLPDNYLVKLEQVINLLQHQK